MPSGWRGYRACLTKPHDGDSFWTLCDVGFDARVEPELRLADVHAPELTGLPRILGVRPMRLPRGQTGGRETTEFVAATLSAYAASGVRWPLSVGVSMNTAAEPSERRTFTRFVAVVFPYLRWPRPWETPMPHVSVSLNYAVADFLAQHPDWPTGE